MAPTLAVCNGGSCSGNGSSLAIRDIEEICFGHANVELTGCLGHCGKGPNCKVTQSGQKSKVINNLKKVSKMETMASDTIEGFELSDLQRKVVKLKFTARREEKAADRLAKISEALTLLGPEAKASAAEPALFAQLLVMRARENVKGNAAAALKDAQKAMTFIPNWAYGQVALSQALEASNQIHEAVEAMAAAIKIGYGVDKSALKRQLQRLEKKAADAPPPTEAEKKEVVAGAGVGPLEEAAPEAPVVKPKGKAGAKAGAKATSRGKEAAKLAGASSDKPAGTRSEKTAAEATEVAKPEELVVPEFQEWEVTTVKKANHDCLRMELSCKSKTKIYKDDIWHIDLLAALGDEEVRRAYTPVSSAEDFSRGVLDLMFKVVPGGRLTEHLATLQPGSNLRVSQPHRTLDPTEYREGVVMVAGGSAVTVALQVCESILALVERKNAEDAITAPAYLSGGEVHLVLCNKTAEDVLFVDRFEGLLKANASFHVTHCLSKGKPPATSADGRATWRAGRLNEEVMNDLPRRFKAVVSGPGGLCRTSFDLLQKFGRSEEQIAVLDSLPDVEEEILVEVPIPEQMQESTKEVIIDRPSTSSSGCRFGLGSFWWFASCTAKCQRMDDPEEEKEADSIGQQL